MGKALPATAANIEKFEARRAELEAEEAKEVAVAQERADALTDVNVIMRAKSGDEGKLFGSIGTRDIAEALTNSGLEVDRAEIKLLKALYVKLANTMLIFSYIMTLPLLF